MDDDLFMFSSSRSYDSTPRKPISLSLSKKLKLQTTHNDRNDSMQSDSKSLSPSEQLDEKPRRRIVKDEEDEDDYLMIDDAINDPVFWQQLDCVEKQYHDKEQPQHNIKATNDLKNEDNNDKTFASENDDMDSWPVLDDDDDAINDPVFWQQLDCVEKQYHDKEQLQHNIKATNDLKNEDNNDKTFASENDDMDSWPVLDDDTITTTRRRAIDVKVGRSSSMIDLDCDEDMFQSHTPADPVTKLGNDTNIDTSEDEAIEQLKALAVSKPIPTKCKVGEDVFTESHVKTWKMPRIKAWESRYVNPEGYYLRFVVPGEGQRNGGWSASEHKLFMDRYKEWIAKEWKIGCAWGLFSQTIPHRQGWQCMDYFRKLVDDGIIAEPSYATADDKLKLTRKDRSLPEALVLSKIGDEWESEEVKEIERNVDRWLKEYHHRSGTASTSGRPPRVSGKAPRAPKTPATRKPISDMVKKIPHPRRPLFVFDDDDNDEDAMDVFLSTKEPEHANLHVQTHDYEKELRARLEAYNNFMQPFLDPIKRHEYWRAKQEWRRGLTTTEMLVTKTTATLKTALPEEKPTTARQSSLFMFFTGAKKPNQDTPDDLISEVVIPNELSSEVHHIRPLGLDQGTPSIPENGRSYYCELDDMAECPAILEALLGPANPEPAGKGSSPVEMILADPPWNFYVKDGRNDGRCSWTLKDMMRLMKKVLTRMTTGLVFIWTHKLIQADVVRLMDELDCRYIENLVWVKKYINNIPVDQPSPYISSSKEILLIFRKGDGFELPYQQPPDVIIDFEQPVSQWIQHEFTEPKPAAVYDMIETLLPEAGHNEELGPGCVLDLWTKRDAPRRDGWIAFHQRKTDHMTTSATTRDFTTNETDGIHDKTKNETSSNSIDKDSIMGIL